MLEQFKAFLKNDAAMSDAATERMSALAIARTLRRNELLLMAGDICRHKIFIVEGLLRSFTISNDGNEHVLQFAPEHSWTLDVESYDRQTPALANIGAIESSKILMWQKADFEMLRNELPELKQLSDALISRNIHYARQRMIITLSASPEEKYDNFVSTFPALTGRVPLRMIAGYLGISLKTLTRIRHAQLQR